MKRLTCFALAAVASAAFSQSTFSGFSSDAAGLTDIVNTYRNALGPLNANQGGIQNPNGRREINWDGVPDARSSPNDLPNNFFNVNSPRGVVFGGANAFRVSADNDNPTNTPPLFADLNPSYADTFSVFSSQRLFSSLGTNVYDVNFFVAGSNAAGLTRGFGAVFTDVDLQDTTKIEYFGEGGNLLHTAFAEGKVSNKTLSFVGVLFDAPIVSRVRITQGNSALGLDDGDGRDIVVADDFLYGEVVPEPATLLALSAGVGFLLRRRRLRS